jgi:hypothetical protein
LQVDYVEHCGRSSGGEYIHTLSAVDIASSWWEGEPIASRSQQATQQGLDAIRRRAPFRFLEIHPDNDSGLVNGLLWRYCRRVRIKMSRSRPYKKNDNAWVEQRNWTHVRKLVGYGRFDTTAELAVMRELYACVRLYKNFFQPTMKLTRLRLRPTRCTGIDRACGTAPQCKGRTPTVSFPCIPFFPLHDRAAHSARAWRFRLRVSRTGLVTQRRNCR